MFFNRHSTTNIDRAITQSPVVLILGSRQIGKTTLVRKIAQEKGFTYVSLDDIRLLSSIQQDPVGFIDQYKGATVILDEIQRAPELFLPIKKAVDESRKPGMFILTGSANPLLAPKIADSLAGRMRIIHLWPLSQGELQGDQERFLEKIFSDKIQFLNTKAWKKEHYIQALLRGGYPSLQNNATEQEIDDWCESYLSTLLQRDVQDLARIEGLASLPNLLKLLATRLTGIMNSAELSRTSALSTTTLNRYIILLEALFLIYRQPAWSGNFSKRLVKAPKNYFVDTAVASYLLTLNEQRLKNEPQFIGPLLENFVANELGKQVSWHENRLSCYYFRTQTGAEVDFVIENKLGHIVGIEVKASQSINSDAFKGLKVLKETIGEKFLRGIVLYTGDLVLPFGDNMLAVPVSCLWE